MGLRQRVKLELEDGTVIETEYNGIDLRAWETANHASAIDAPMSVGFLTWLGWHAAERRGDLNGSYSDWEAFDKVCADVEVVRDQTPPTKAKKRATRKAPTDTSSAP